MAAGRGTHDCKGAERVVGTGYTIPYLGFHLTLFFEQSREGRLEI